MNTVVVAEPTGMIISLDEAKAHLRIDHTSDDGYIQALINSSIIQVENILNRKLLTQTWKYYLDNFPNKNQIKIPFGKLQSITHIKYTDSNGTQSTFTDYFEDIYSDPGGAVLNYSYSWPTDTLYPKNAIEIQFVCGYGAHTLKSITNATNASPIVVFVATHGYITGNRVLISNVSGNTNANGEWNITRVDDNSFSLDSSTGNAAYVSGGNAVKIDVPEQIRIAILLILANNYKYRESIQSDNRVQHMEIPNYIMNLLWPYRLFWY